MLSLFRFLQRRCKTAGYKAEGCDRSDNKFKMDSEMLSRYVPLYNAFMRQLLEYAAERDALKEDV